MKTASAWVSTKNLKKGGIFSLNATEDHFYKTLFYPRKRII